jgi:hypothetical protein
LGGFAISSSLTTGAIVGTPSGKHDAANGHSADQAGLAGTHVDAVLKLEEASHPVGINVVGN